MKLECTGTLWLGFPGLSAGEPTQWYCQAGMRMISIRGILCARYLYFFYLFNADVKYVSIELSTYTGSGASRFSASTSSLI
jgi:hypothetical protein